MLNLTRAFKQITRTAADYRAARRSRDREKAALRKLQEQRNDIVQAIEIAQLVCQEIQQRVHQQIATVVSKCLTEIFDEPYTFVIAFEKRRNRTEARLVFVREGQEIDPLTASGGGVVDVASFALRLACLVLAQPPARKVLILDEPFKFVSAQYRPRVRGLLESLSEEMGVQFIFVTHTEEFQCGTVVNIE